MKIAVVGGGRIGSVFAFRLATAGHEVSVVARGERLAALQQAGGIGTVDGRTAPVRALAALEPDALHDLLIVTVPEHQLPPLIGELAASSARTILLMFNAFKAHTLYADALGRERVAFGFPNMAAFLEQQRLRYKLNGPGMVTTLSSPELAALLRAAGLPTEVESDMEAFLRSHVALVLPFFLAALRSWRRPTALTWSEAAALAGGWREGFGAVRTLGHDLKPRAVALLARMPTGVATAMLWVSARTAAVRDLGQFGPAETRWLIDAMSAAVPGQMPRLLSLRP